MSKCYWITGLSASGKTTLSKLLVDHFKLSDRKVILLDGDDLRQVFNHKAYTKEERINIGMKYSRLCQLISSQGVDVVIAVIGLFKEIHDWNRKNIPNYVEIFIDTPMHELKRRDPKGLYKQYADGEIQNIAGLDLEVNFPENPDVHLKWSNKKTIAFIFQELLNNLHQTVKEK